MSIPKLSKLEMQIMDALWTKGECSVREIHDEFPEKGRPAYTTVQTMVNRLEAKGAVERAKKIGNSLIFRATLSRTAAHRRLVDEFFSFFDGRVQPVIAHLIQSGKLTGEDIKEAQKLLKEHTEKREPR
ncbi:putative transcriptional regulator [Silvibacterium bohemicum]|uniref:Putative transcriptional regulator n=1 Tax=Silvibacterium bohemicum TaxID=1577686 RepID=A0A841JYP3_9BACT|nr:BlaI/MecI/CopY family transcriptional regulator [Silvibacterium bohemicum]MBB6144091.1 putative transcriptional regulator [Silvibacterium bohemicum]